MHRQFYFQTSFKLMIVTVILMIIFGLLAFTPTMAENNNIQVSERELHPASIGVNTKNNSPAVQLSPNRDKPPLVDNFSELPIRFDLNEDEPTPLSIRGMDIVLPWSQIAFSSYRDNNWEIIVANDDGSNERRLTYNAAADTLPQMDRGCKRITFSSNRDGDDEIFIMNVDGSGLRQLTSNTAHDFNPTWSPDGSKIAFQSYRNGQYEIYVMNADGSQQTRLTTNGAYDGMPDWSPNGQKIAFVSTRSDGWRIWVMNADGSNPLQLSTQAYSENPIWSPDGSQIAYDADGDNDGWQELWVMNTDGTNQQTIYNPGYSHDAWASSWSPDGKYIAFTQATWINNEEIWYWVSAQLYRWHMPYGGSALMHTGNSEAHPNWQTMDTTPPHSQVEDLPDYLRTNAEVYWVGEDQGGAGIRHYDIQYRLDTNTNWINWQTDIPDDANNMAVFPHQSGDKIHFRSRAVDESFNEEAWKSDNGDTATTFYKWAINGIATDNRQTPLEEVTTSTTEAFEFFPSNINGIYHSYFSAYDDVFPITWDKTGYLNLPMTSFNSNRDATHNVVLPPADNIIQDWGFESGQIPSSVWLTSGLYTPTITDTESHTGSYAAFLGNMLAFEDPTVLYSSGYSNFKPQIALDNTDGLHALWTSVDYDQTRIHYAFRTPARSWDLPQTITPQSAYISQIQWGVSDTGRVHVIWISSISNQNILYHSWRNENGDWATPRIIYGQGWITPIRLIVDNNGDAHLVWQLEDTTIDDFYYAHTDHNGNWSSPSRIGATGAYAVDHLAIDNNGTAHLLWRYSGDSIYYSYHLPDGTWSTRELVFPGGYNWYQRFEVTDQGQVNIIWQNVSYGKLYHRQRNANGMWTQVKILSENQNLDDQMYVKTNLEGTTYIVWPEAGVSYNCSDLAYSTIDNLGQWTGPTIIRFEDRCVQKIWLNLDNEFPFIVFKSNEMLCSIELNQAYLNKPRCATPSFSDNELNVVSGNNQIVYVIGRENDDILFTETAREQDVSTSTINQEIAVSNTLSHPTLSFMYLLDGSAENGGYLEASVRDSVATSTLFTTTTPTSDWIHQWLDLSPWSGQNITVTFQVNQIPGELSTAAFLDEVTLGSAYPDTWVNLNLPSGVGAGWPVNLVINYGNRGGVATDGGQLMLTLPDEISFVSAQPAPTTITPIFSWELEPLDAGSNGSIIVTGLMDSDANFNDFLTIIAELNSNSVELEMHNNEYEQIVQVGHKMFLPIIMK